MHFSVIIVFSYCFLFNIFNRDVYASTEVCSDLGFNSLILKCETCDDLQRVVADTQLFDDCMNCCIKTSDLEMYEKGILEVDQRFVGSFSNMGDIIESIKQLRSNKSNKNKDLIKIRYTFGAMPQLLVYGKAKDDTPSEKISMHGWSKDDFEDYLKNHIKSIAFNEESNKK